MADEDWIYDYILQFLKSPSWTVPILSFIDDNCVVFDNEEENKFIYTDIHNQFKEMIDNLLDLHLSELGLSPEALVTALSKGNNQDVHAVILEQLLAAEDFLNFKKLMVRRNMELEIEALKMLSNAMGAAAFEGAAAANESQNQLPETVQEEGEAYDNGDEDDEEERQFQEAIRLSQLAASGQGDVSEAELALRREEAELEHAIAVSLALEEERLRQQQEAEEMERHALLLSKQSTPVPPAAELAERVAPVPIAVPQRVASEVEPAPSKPAAQLPPVRLGSKKLAPLVNTRADQDKIALLQKAQEVISKPSPAVVASQSTSPAAVSEDEIQRRQQYLKEQRDRLIAKKNAERQQQLVEYHEQKQQAPAVIPAAVQEAAEQAKEEIPLDDKRLAIRLALARKMKQDILEADTNKKESAQANAYSKLDEQLRKVELLREQKQKLGQFNAGSGAQ
eukprot:GILK01001550.1.p1 GENE.GILK01001550.1~~GILK01001550.1.p1  ORF type:complete len:467 (-),score=130.55 GILK01001550.1:826-2181(-)